MSTELAVQAPSELAIDPRQTGFTDAQVAVLKQIGIDDAPPAQIDLFFHYCQQTALDPFRKQIYMIGRKTKVGGYRGEPERWETKWTIQTGIDGFRLNGRRAAKRVGAHVKKEGPFYIGIEGGEWSKVWLNPNHPPAAARFVIYRDGDPYEAVCHYWEYVQTTGFGENQRANAQWSKMPAHMLGKCAEALAWRQAFEDDFAGLVLEDAAHVVDGGVEPEPTQRKSERVSRGSAGLRDRLGIKDDDSVAEAQAASDKPAEDIPANDTPDEAACTRAQQTKLAILLGEVGLTDRQAKLDYLEQQFARKFGSSKELTKSEASALIEYLESPPDAYAPESDVEAAPEVGAE